MATIHNLTAVNDQWRTLDPANASSAIVLADISPLDVATILGACKLDGQYFAVIWSDTDSDLQLGVYNRTGASFNYVEVSNNTGGSDARIERVSDTEVLIYYYDATAADWKLAIYSHSSGTVSGTPDATLSVGSTSPGQTELHDMCVLSSTRAVVSYASSGSPYQITFKGVTIGASSLTADAASAANTSDINNAASVALSKYDSSNAIVYWVGGGAGASTISANMVIDGTPITFGTDVQIGTDSAAFYANSIPAVSDDGTLVLLPYQGNSLTASAGFVTAASISGTTLSVLATDYPTTTSPNLPNSDAGTSTGSMAASCCYLDKEKGWHVGAVIGNYKDPQKNGIWGMVVAFKDDRTLALGGSFRIPAGGAANNMPFLFRQDSGTLTIVYENDDGNPAFIDITRSPT